MESHFKTIIELTEFYAPVSFYVKFMKLTKDLIHKNIRYLSRNYKSSNACFIFENKDFT